MSTVAGPYWGSRSIGVQYLYRDQGIYLFQTYFPPHHLLHPWQPNTLVTSLAHNSHVSSVVAIGGPKQSSHTQKLPAALLCCRQNHLTTTEIKHYINMDLDKDEACHTGFIFGKRFWKNAKMPITWKIELDLLSISLILWREMCVHAHGLLPYFYESFSTARW